ncbi:hypothetical protein P168DRAFT_305064 [Aspergillus campestris IBT 28561]|uniref:Pyridoxamine 5'-phosphate oxidase Alr4036 family FMN-binding domain-containing protein n=1 Tax=Aspergillus campestris (strain IBT 28561) TaxID=1392248 RepID=A0A2I1D1I0_ASPC2|nr:uncharacterized protein P168DRAFT_305064 [Aspergillus campestris IBT 28561]PKY03730.1 hypothetical protein P168DRAFT_305064 [Aspergillus campestris IBT 28561]
MSSSTTAPWRTPLESTLTTHSTTSFTLSTATLDPKTNLPVPRSRTCEFRGFFPTPPLHPSALQALSAQNVPLNPAIYESDLLSFTTDARMEKTAQLRESGGAVEAVFWVKGAMVQWRVRGCAFAIGGGGEEEGAARERIMGRLRRMGEATGEDKDWDWERVVTAYFANMSPVMRGSFTAPPPGQPRSQVPADPNYKMGQPLEDLNDPVARANFRVVVILPDEVERLDLSDYANVTRRRWTLGSESGEWVEEELWP